MRPVSAGEPLPLLYEKWAGELLGGPIPRESMATCDRCAMVRPEGLAGDPPRGEHYFDPAVRCCTYLPELRNFLVGGILSDEHPAAAPGRATVEKRIAASVSVTPLGLAQTPVYSLLYKNSEESFGRTRGLVCPHLLPEGRCGIWRHRNYVCATWFCKHVRGALGRSFWIDAIHPLLRMVEGELARWCVLELHPSDDVLRQLVANASWDHGEPTVTGAAIDGRVEPKEHAKLWGDWRGREIEFFRRCAEMVAPLTWEQVTAIGGTRVRAHALIAQQAYRRLLSDDIPPALEAGRVDLVRIRNVTTRVQTYSGYDPLDVPQSVMEALGYFDGRPTEEALAMIAEELAVRVEPDLLRKLVDFELLVPPGK